MSNKNNERAEVRIRAEIKLVRVDYRLIHGQVVARWLKVCPVRRIVLVDDVLGSDEFMSEHLQEWQFQKEQMLIL